MHYKDKSQVLEYVNSSMGGLSSEEAKKRLEKYGQNELPVKKSKNKFLRFLGQFSDVMIIILLFAAMVSIVVALIEHSFSEIIDGIVIFVIVFINAIIGYVQEINAEREMKALLQSAETEVKVYRDGEVVKIPASQIVVGDVLCLEVGDILPADVRFLETINAECDESSLTGESVPICKDALKTLEKDIPLADRSNCGYKGSVLTGGRATAVVVATGKDTEIGKISVMLNTAKKNLTPLQKNIKTVGKIITIIVLAIAVLTFVLEITTKKSPDILNAFLVAVAISVAAIPESLPAVITIIMSFGVAKLSKKKAIVKNLNSVETLGSTQIICSDKTGTLTQNKMEVRALFANNEYMVATGNIREKVTPLLQCMLCCNDSKSTHLGYIGDPTEVALCNFAESLGWKKCEQDKMFGRVKELQFDSKRKCMSTINETIGGYTLHTKGALDEILNMCSKILIGGKEVELTQSGKDEILHINEKMCKDALRVLAFAVKSIEKDVDIKSYKIEEQDLTFVGLVGMIDPPRKEAFEAVITCKNAGMIPVMITGDHANTAFAIAKQLGIAENEDQILLGKELDKLSDKEFEKIIYKTRVYARVSPENKVRIVKTFQRLGNIVAMTGDGVNDASSIKMADIGVGMGISGTDVTKEVSDILITDDNFATIIVAVEEGRKIYANIKKTIGFLFASNIGEILSLLIATIFFPQFAFLLPVQILFVNLITDGLPAIALGMEPAQKNIMKNPPRDKKKTLFSDGTAVSLILIGIVQTAIIISSFAIGLTYSPEVATTMAFVSLNLVQLFYLLSIRDDGFILSKRFFTNKWMWLALCSGIALLTLVVATPVNSILGLTILNIKQLGITIALSLAVCVFSEILKWVLRKINNSKNRLIK